MMQELVSSKGWVKLLSINQNYFSKPSFYVNYESLRRVEGGFRGEKLVL